MQQMIHFVLSLHIFAMANSKGIPRDPEKKARSRIGIFSIIMVLLVTLLMLLEAMAGVAPVQSNNPAAASVNIEPNPMLNTNITWSTFHSSWSPMEYSNGSTNLTLQAQESSIYANPISINPSDVVMNGTLQNDKVAGTVWNSIKPMVVGTLTGGAVATAQNLTIGTVNTPSISINGSESAAETIDFEQFASPLQISSLPSNNIEYDYITFGMALSGENTTGAYAQIFLYNGTNTFAPSQYKISAGQSLYLSVNLAQLNAIVGGEGFNITGKQAAQSFEIFPRLITPTAPSADRWTLDVFAYALTTYPISYGENATGAAQTQIAGIAHLSDFNPTSPATVYNSGYTVAVSQPLQNLTTQQSAISSGSYVEQVEYQGGFSLPMAPDLSYGTANLTEHFNVSTAQVQVLDINGVSYLAAISGKNGTVQLLSSVNPNGQTQFLQIVDYTQSQWTSISSPPGIFTIQGIEYYWEEFIIAILAVVGIGAGAASKHASSLRKVK